MLPLASISLIAAVFPCQAAEEPATAPESKTSAFNKKLSLQGITFQIHCKNQGSLNQLRITPKGLESDNSAITTEIDGSLTGAEVADLNADGSPEIYVYVQSAGSGSYASLVAYAANNKKSLTQIHLPPLADDPKLSKGYMGHDEFAVVENSLARRFPLYNPGDSNSKPTGKTRQIEYKLEAGEAGWILRIKKSTDS